MQNDKNIFFVVSLQNEAPQKRCFFSFWLGNRLSCYSAEGAGIFALRIHPFNPSLPLFASKDLHASEFYAILILGRRYRYESSGKIKLQ